MSYRRHLMASNVKFPYATDGLVAAYDGIWNKAIGKHDDNSSTWIDISGNNHNITLNTAVLWNKDNCYFTINPRIYGYFDQVLNYKSAEFIIKVDNSNDTDSARQEVGIITGMGGLGLFYQSNIGKTYSGTIYFTNNTRFYMSFSHDLHQTKLSVQVVTGQHNNAQDVSEWKGFINGSPKTVSFKSSSIASTSYPVINNRDQRYGDFSIYAMRFYNRTLTDEEFYNHYLIDKKRFKL